MSDLLDDVGAMLDRAAPQDRTSFLDPLRAELAGYVQEMKGLRYREPDEAMAWLSSVSARVLEMIYATLQSDGRIATRFRVEELIPFRDETRYQFQIASRRTSVMQLEWDVARGQET